MCLNHETRQHSHHDKVNCAFQVNLDVNFSNLVGCLVTWHLSWWLPVTNRVEGDRKLIIKH